MAAAGPCVRPTPAEATALEAPIRRWFDSYVVPPEEFQEPPSLEEVTWGCNEPAGILARVVFDLSGGCSRAHALVRVDGKRVTPLEVVVGPGTGHLCGSEGSYFDTLAVLLLDTDGDGSLDPLIARRRHEQTSLGDEWVFVGGKTPEPRHPIPWREVGAGQLIPLRPGAHGETLVYLPHVSTYESYDGPHDGVFLEVLRDGVVTDRSRAARALAAEARRLGTIIAADGELQEATRDSLGAPASRAAARAALRRAGIDGGQIDAALGAEDPQEAAARIGDFVWTLGEEIERRLGDADVCEEPSVAFDAPWQIRAWGVCPMPSAEARKKVEPALRTWLRAKSGPLVDRWLPRERDKTPPVERDEVVVRYGCTSADGFFVFADGGDPHEVSVLFRWDGRALTQLSAVAGLTCDDGCEYGPDRRLEVTLGDVDGDGSMDAVVLADGGCDASPTKKGLDLCTRSTIHLGRPDPRKPTPGRVLSREDERGASACRVGGTVHLIDGGTVHEPPGLLATVGPGGFAPKAASAPYVRRRRDLEANLEATRLVLDPNVTDSDRLRAALERLNVSPPDVAAFLASRKGR